MAPHFSFFLFLNHFDPSSLTIRCKHNEGPGRGLIQLRLCDRLLDRLSECMCRSYRCSRYFRSISHWIATCRCFRFRLLLSGPPLSVQTRTVLGDIARVKRPAPLRRNKSNVPTERTHCVRSSLTVDLVEFSVLDKTKIRIERHPQLGNAIGRSSCFEAVAKFKTIIILR